MLRSTKNVKQVIGNTQPTLTADANESYRVTGLRISGSASAQVTVEVNRTTVASFRCSGTQGNHLFWPVDDQSQDNLYDWLLKNGHFRPIPVPAGYTLTITGAHDADSVVQILYDKYDPGDVTADEPNGPESNQFDFIQYGQFNTTLADGENLLDTQASSSQFPSFPFDRVVPAKTEITIRGIAFSGIAKDTSAGTNQQRTNYLKLVRNRKVLFDDDLNGLLYRGSASYTSNTTLVGDGNDTAGNLSDADYNRPLMFDPPLVFQEGEDLDIYIDTTLTTGSANILAVDAQVALIMSVNQNI